MTKHDKHNKQGSRAPSGQQQQQEAAPAAAAPRPLIQHIKEKGKPSTPQRQTSINNELAKRWAIKDEDADNLEPDNSTSILLA
ncbi:unnamed protein product [Fusarium graminearum]|nr:unnamed protein product [Fusarium graminearum]